MNHSELLFTDVIPQIFHKFNQLIQCVFRRLMFSKEYMFGPYKWSWFFHERKVKTITCNFNLNAPFVEICDLAKYNHCQVVLSIRYFAFWGASCSRKPIVEIFVDSIILFLTSPGAVKHICYSIKGTPSIYSQCLLKCPFFLRTQCTDAWVPEIMFRIYTTYHWALMSRSIANVLACRSCDIFVCLYISMRVIESFKFDK